MSRDDRHPDHTSDLPDEPARLRGGLIVEPARATAPTGSIPLLAGVALAAAVVALAVAGLFAPATPPLAASSPGASSSPGAAPGSGGPAEPVTAPSATLPVHDVRSGDAAVAELTRLVGWTTCPVWREFEIGAPVTRRDVEAAVTATGVDVGLVDVTDVDGHIQRVWLGGGAGGGGAGAAVAGFGGMVIVRDVDTVWTVIVEGERAVAVRLAAGVRRDGGTFWQIRGRASLAPYCNGSVGVDGPVKVIHVLGAGQARLFTEAGWVGCKTWYRTGRTVLPEPGTIEAAGRAAGLGPDDSGWVDLPLGEGYGAASMRTWFGRDEEAAARAHGSRLMVVEDGDTTTAWLRVEFGGREIAVQFRIIETPEGRKSWLATPNASGIVSGCEAAG